MRNILSLILIMACAPIANAQVQAAYSGGAGDGYAMAELELQPLLSGGTSVELELYPTILQAGTFIRLPHGLVTEQAYLVGISGISVKLQAGDPAGSFYRIPEAVPGLYILRFSGPEGKRYHARIIVMAP